jgi:beta-galactosidase
MNKYPSGTPVAHSRRSLLAYLAALTSSLFSKRSLAHGLSSGEKPVAAESFGVEGDHFQLNGKPFQIIAGEMHYARIPREYWTHRIRMAKAMGLNTIATYVFWNVHEPRPGVYDFSGNNDIAAFLREIQAEGLYVVLRAGPYSCAEWEFGGFPAWLLKDPKMHIALRSNDDAFMVPVERWMNRLAKETSPLLIANGGPILAVQVENEYGNFSNDKVYLRHMLQIFQSTGYKDALLYTVDPSKALANGSLDGVLSGVNFGTANAEHGLGVLAAMRPGQPLFASEYWPGWFDLWGHPHETRPLAPQLKDLEYILDKKASINIYMFHGGTSFGMMAGASASTGNYRGNVTSYDYDAPLDEAGHPTAKFFAYRDLILKYSNQAKLPVPPVAPIVMVPEFRVAGSIALWEHLPKPIASERPLMMEEVDQAYGYILYRTQLDRTVQGETLSIDPIHDFALVYIDGVFVGTLDRHYNQTTLSLTSTRPARLDILVENTGRLNSTKNMRTESKGMRSATLAGVPLTNWQIYPLPMDKVGSMRPSEKLDGRSGAYLASTPQFAFGNFTLEQTGDAFLDVSALSKGVIWINGHALGRFWNIGPQKTLYVPAPWLKKGKNEVVLFDLLGGASSPTLVGRMSPMLDGATPAYASDPERKKKAAPDAEFGPKLAAPATTPKQM